nr:sugar-binding domain-containing protein [Mesorhizobium tianshanense]
MAARSIQCGIHTCHSAAINCACRSVPSGVSRVRGGGRPKESWTCRCPATGQVLSPELDDYRNIPCRIVSSGGGHKRAILLAVARAGLATVIVTEADSARNML